MSFDYAFRMDIMGAFLGDPSIGEIVGGGLLLFVSAFGVFFWGSGLGWREQKKDRRNGL
jgi:hypothetical protein